jgi:hypothetical protein
MGDASGSKRRWIMSKTFSAESTTNDVLQGIDLAGMRVLVTGVSAGLGVETARTLAAHGAQVVGAARNLDKARRGEKRGDGPGTVFITNNNVPLTRSGAWQARRIKMRQSQPFRAR